MALALTWLKKHASKPGIHKEVMWNQFEAEKDKQKEHTNLG
jgi:lipopolysaccharide biosynthesis protein